MMKLTKTFKLNKIKIIYNLITKNHHNMNNYKYINQKINIIKNFFKLMNNFNNN
jgi:hypothetical protein